MDTIDCIDDNRRVSSVRVLVVEDYEPFRRFVCSTLGERPELQVIGEASDGLEAVQKAEDLKPELILLDIGLPTLNGVEASHRISRVAPHVKIVFVTQEDDPDVVRAVLDHSPRGYVLKADANSELLPAVNAVLKGKQFVSTGVKLDTPICFICEQPIRLETAKTDENGQPVHEDCYLRRLMAPLQDPPSPQHAE